MLASSAPQNGSIVLTIAVRTGPITASPRRNARNAITVHTTASSTIASHEIGGTRIASPPPAPARTTKISAAPPPAHVAVTAGGSPPPQSPAIRVERADRKAG